MKTTTHFDIPYPEPSDPPTISAHIKAIAENVDATLWSYQQTLNAAMASFTASETAARSAFQTASQQQWAAWKTPLDTRMAAIEAALQETGWGTPVAVVSPIAMAAGWTHMASSAFKVGNVCAFRVRFRKTADPAVVAGSSGNISGVVIGTLSAAMPKPVDLSPLTTTDFGYMITGYVNTSKTVVIETLAPNVNLPKTYDMSLGGVYVWNPSAP